ncbi:MAG: hypothetical protein RL219_1810 [Actinomycetota bacterium]|jgi:FMN phosphatase YigB (HAD superfamily)
MRDHDTARPGSAPRGPAPTRAVLSDWGHTLFDTAGSVEFLDRWAREHGQEVPVAELGRRYREAFARSRTASELAKGRDLSAERHRGCWLDLWRDIDAVLPGASGDLYEFETGPLGWRPFPDTKAFLEALAAMRIPLVVVSDVPFDLRPIFAHYDLAHLVHSFFLSGEHGTVKAEGELFRLALDSVGVQPNEAIMIGDNPSNDGYAVFSGIPTVLLPLPEPGAPRGLERVLRLIEAPTGPTGQTPT